jgi:hypothetical protein
VGLKPQPKPTRQRRSPTSRHCRHDSPPPSSPQTTCQACRSTRPCGAAGRLDNSGVHSCARTMVSCISPTSEARGEAAGDVARCRVGAIHLHGRVGLDDRHVAESSGELRPLWHGQKLRRSICSFQAGWNLTFVVDNVIVRRRLVVLQLLLFQQRRILLALLKELAARSRASRRGAASAAAAAAADLSSKSSSICRRCRRRQKSGSTTARKNAGCRSKLQRTALEAAGAGASSKSCSACMQTRAGDSIFAGSSCCDP